MAKPKTKKQRKKRTKPAPIPTEPKKAGRKRTFETPDEMEIQIDEYFVKCENEMIPITMTGLAVSLGLTRKSLCDYKQREGFSDLIEYAKSRVEEKMEIYLLTSKSPTGVIFNLKNNFGWTDKSEVSSNIKADVTSEVKVSIEDYLKDSDLKL